MTHVPAILSKYKFSATRRTAGGAILSQSRALHKHLFSKDLKRHHRKRSCIGTYLALRTGIRRVEAQIRSKIELGQTKIRYLPIQIAEPNLVFAELEEITKWR